jgi:hypothetical protein
LTPASGPSYFTRSLLKGVRDPLGRRGTCLVRDEFECAPRGESVVVVLVEVLGATGAVYQSMTIRNRKTTTTLLRMMEAAED